MAEIDASRAKKILSTCIGPAPWYWKTFPVFHSFSKQRFAGRITGPTGLSRTWSRWVLNRNQTRLALNTYCRPFLVPPHFLGVWCPEGRNIRLTCFDPDQLKAFDLAEVAGWFKQSSDRIYAATPPIADFEIPLTLAAGTHKIHVPAELRGVDELIVPSSYKAMSNDDPAFALFV